MAIQFKVTNGPSQLDLMLALFDPEPLGQTRTVTFTLQGMNWPTTTVERERRSPEEAAEAEIYEHDLGPADYEIVVHAVERDIQGGLIEIVGCCIESRDLVTVTDYSTKKRSGWASIEHSSDKRDLDSPWPRSMGVICDGCGDNFNEGSLEKDPENGNMLCHHCLASNWTCDWCRNSFKDHVAHPRQTFDGGTICSECFERDVEGPQIAQYGIDAYEAKNEPERVVDADGKVDYE